MADNTNPDLVDVADQAFGVGLASQVPNFKVLPASASERDVRGGGGHRPFVVDQEITVTTPATASVNNITGTVNPNLPAVVVNQPVTTGPAQNAGTNVNGGTFSPTSPNVQNTTQNNVVGQVYGTGVPRNVNV